MGHLLFAPHHDGSPLYVGDEAPALGSTVTLRCRTSPRTGVSGVWVRSTPDAEPHFDQAVVEQEDDAVVWWRAEMLVRNPVQRYRFMIASGDDYVWLNAAGVFDHDVPDAFDFVLSTYPPAPDWARDATVYQIFPDRFARSSAADGRPTPPWALAAQWDDEVIFSATDPDTPRQLYGGDLDGIRDHLDHLDRLGADTVYTTPVFPGASNHRYNASTFEHVDPVLGGDEALERLAKDVHDRGWHLLGDLTTNHTGNTHEWFRRAQSDPASPERDYYYFADDDTYEGWKQHPTLPKLDHTNEVLRHRFVEGGASIVARWLHPPFELDGWRIDVANMTGRHADVDVNHDVARHVRWTSEAARPEALVVAEHNHDASGDLDGDGWHGTMNYTGFSFPVWTWLRDQDGPVPRFGVPVPLPRRTGEQAARTIREFIARFGWRAFGSSWNILSSHDSPRIRTVTGSPERHRVAAGLQFTLPGVPMVFAGDEIGLEGVNGEDSRRPMPWHDPGSWDEATLSTYSRLAALRRSHTALRRGGLRWVHLGDDALVYLREHPDGSLLVVAAREDAGTLTVPAGPLGLGDGTVLMSTTDGADDLVGALPAAHTATAATGAATVDIPLHGPAFTVYAL
ncbi:MAG TPA: glycoside hydrolase family 13 protein [Nocardioidaceae bacterium]|nr:glycoside hydrolase family 13 protein [Nocardioidaceae bacterium]